MAQDRARRLKYTVHWKILLGTFFMPFFFNIVETNIDQVTIPYNYKFSNCKHRRCFEIFREVINVHSAGNEKLYCSAILSLYIDGVKNIDQSDIKSVSN